MPTAMGRPRERHKDLPPGVRVINGRYYWKPTSAAERAARKAKGLKATVPLGADPMEMRRAWVRLNPSNSLPAEGTVAYLIAIATRSWIASIRGRASPSAQRRPATNTVGSSASGRNASGQCGMRAIPSRPPPAIASVA